MRASAYLARAALLTHSTIVGVVLLFSAGGGFGCSLTAKGIAPSGEDVGVMAQAVEQRDG